MNRDQIIEVDMLLDCIKENKIKKSDLKFILDNLTLDKKNLFNKLLDEKEIKEKRERNKKKLEDIQLKKCVISIFNNPMLLSEMSVVLANKYKNSSIAVIESDRLNPRLDTFFNSDRNIKGIYTHLDMNRSTSINLLIDSLHKNRLTKLYVDNLANKVKGFKNIKFFTGSYLIGDYEYFHIDDYIKILSFIKSKYDIVLISTNDFIYDAFTCVSLIESDINIIGMEASVPEVMKVKKYFNFLEEKQNINKDKNLYLSFNYNKKIHIQESYVKEMLHNNYLGKISYNMERLFGIQDHYLYIDNISQKNKQEYKNIFNKIIERV